MSNVEKTKKIDPINKNYYSLVERTEKISTITFYIAAAFSCLLLLLDKNLHYWLYDSAQTLFIIAVILMFVLEFLTYFYFLPRAENKRLKDFLSHAYKVDLCEERTKGYYESPRFFRRVKITNHAALLTT